MARKMAVKIPQAPQTEAYLRGIMPGLSDVQYELRAKLRIARDYASSRLAAERNGDKLPYHVFQLLHLVVDMVNAWSFSPMEDDVLERVVDYCRTLVKSANEAEYLFAGEMNARG